MPGRTSQRQRGRMRLRRGGVPVLRPGQQARHVEHGGQLGRAAVLARQRHRLADHRLGLAVGGLADSQPAGCDQALEPNG